MAAIVEMIKALNEAPRKELIGGIAFLAITWFMLYVSIAIFG